MPETPILPEYIPDTRPSKYFRTNAVKKNGKTLEPSEILPCSCGYKYSSDKKTAYVNAKGWEELSIPAEVMEITKEEFDAV